MLRSYLSRGRKGASARRCRRFHTNRLHRLGVATGLCALTAAGAAVGTGSGAAYATPSNVCGTNQVSVAESSSGVVTSTFLTPGRSLTVTASGSIWSGVWLTGTNGPEGWTTNAGSGFPEPSARAFSLLARVNGAWTYVGQGATVTNTGTTTELLQFRINDDVSGNGSGSFTATFTTCDMSDVPASQYSVRAIVARHSGKCLDVAWASTAHAANVLQGTCWGGTNQQWTARPVGGGYYEIVARHSGKCLDVAWASTAHAADVIQGTCSGGTNQHWRFVPTDSGHYEIVAEHSGMCLDVAWADTGHGADVIQATCVGGTNQQWRFQ
jgi:hypothetical protein